MLDFSKILSKLHYRLYSLQIQVKYFNRNVRKAFCFHEDTLSHLVGVVCQLLAVNVTILYHLSVGVKNDY